MLVSVVIPTHDQQHRLRLVLAGLEGQTLEPERYEVIVVDDGSTDGTADLLAGSSLPQLRVHQLPVCCGRNAARNAGARLSDGDLVVFLDGDALPAPDLLERYVDAWQDDGQAIMCGSQYCLPQLEYFDDPEAGTYADGDLPSVLMDYLDSHAESLRLGRDTILKDFDIVRQRASAGGYPFPESAEKQRQTSELLLTRPEAAVRWLGFVPHNGAVPRAWLERCGGFDEHIPFSEGWELAYRLQRQAGATIRAVPAESYHLYHRHVFDASEAGAQEAAKRYQAIEYMVDRHGDERIRLLYFWFASLWPDPFLPEEALVYDLLELDELYEGMDEALMREYQLLIENHPTIPTLSTIEAEHEQTI